MSILRLFSPGKRGAIAALQNQTDGKAGRPLDRPAFPSEKFPASRKEGNAPKRRCAYRLSRSIISSERVDSKAKASANRTSIIQFPITLSSVLS